MLNKKIRCFIISMLIMFNFLYLIESPMTVLSIPLGEPPNIENQINYGGHWNVTNSTYRGNQTIILDGNLTVEFGGKLVFSNVTLKLNCSANGTYSIRVENGGILEILDNSVITSNSTDGLHKILFWVEQNATLTVKNSRIEEVGYSGAIGNRTNFRKSGLLIEGGASSFESTTFLNCSYGLIIDNTTYDSRNLLKSLSFVNQTNGLYFNSSSGIISTMTFKNASTAVVFKEGGNSVEGIVIEDSSSAGIISYGEYNIFDGTTIRDSNIGIILTNKSGFVYSGKFFNTNIGVYSSGNDTYIRSSEFTDVGIAAYLTGNNSIVSESKIYNATDTALLLKGTVSAVLETEIDFSGNGIVYYGNRTGPFPSSIFVNFTRIWDTTGYSLYLNGSEIIVLNGSVHNSRIGFFVPPGNSTVWINDTYFDYCSEVGIDVQTANATISNETVAFSGTGIRLGGNGSKAILNTVNNCTYGMNITGNGTFVIDNIVKSNNWSFSPIVNLSDLKFEKNIVILNINGTLSFKGTNNSFVINNMFGINREGISFEGVNNTFFNGNTISLSDWGIHINGSANTRLVNNTVTKNGFGLRINRSVNLIISGNTISGNYNNSIINGTVNTTIIDNEFLSNTGLLFLNGIINTNLSGNEFLSNTGLLRLNGTNRTMIYDNRLLYNDNGLYLSGINTTIVGNTFNNTGFDLNLSYNDRNSTSVYHNNFYGNIIEPRNASVWGLGYPDGGNYYHNSGLVDRNSTEFQNVSGPDGLLDKPYVFNTSFNDTDYYPLAVPWPVNRLPRAHNFSFEINITVKPMGVMFKANGSDFEDNESLLTPVFEYRAPNGSWESTSIGDVRYVNGTWIANLTHPLNGSKGWYDIRLRFKDSGGYYSNVIQLNRTFNITTEKPEALGINLSGYSVNRTFTLRFQLNGTDPDESEFNLTPHLELRLITTNTWQSLNYKDLNYRYINFSGNDTGNYTRGFWDLNFTPDIGLKPGTYEIRFRFNDTDFDFSDWFYHNRTLIIVNNLPILTNLTLNQTVVLRTHNLTVQANATDVEDELANLTCIMQYRSPSGTWTDFTNEKYNSTLQIWTAVFAPNITYEPGYYDIRTEFRDGDNESTGWKVILNALNVSNNWPSVLSLNISKTSVYRTGFVNIYINGTDIETPLKDLNPELYYRSQTGNWIQVTPLNFIAGKWFANLTFTTAADLGPYDFRAVLSDPELLPGVNESILHDVLIVMNNIPGVTELQISPRHIYRGEKTTITFKGSDIEDHDSILTTEIEYKTAVTGWTALGQGVYESSFDRWSFEYNIPLTADLGYYDFRVKLIDKDGDNNTWFVNNRALYILNNVPVMHSIEFSETSIYRQDVLKIFINTSDIEDSIEDYYLTEVQMRLPGSAEWVSLDNAKADSGLLSTSYLFDMSMPVGKYSFRSVVLDSNFNDSNWIEAIDAVSVLNRDPQLLDARVDPFNGTINTLFNFTVIYLEPEGELHSQITLHLNSEDIVPDEMDPADNDPTDGKLFYYSTTLPVGEYSFYFSAKDKTGGYAESTYFAGVIVENITKPKERGSIEGRVIDNSTGKGVSKAAVFYSTTLSNFLRVETDSNGYYKIPDLKEGIYHVYATASGFSVGVISKIDIKDDQTVIFNILLYREISPEAKKYTVKISAQKLELDIGEDFEIEAVVTIKGDDKPIEDELKMVFLWDFGDGSDIVWGQSQVHNYSKAGTYNITLSVLDEKGVIDITSILVKINSTVYVPPPDDYKPEPVTEPPRQEDENNILGMMYAILGTVMAIVIFLVLVVVIMFLKTREPKPKSKKDKEKEDKDGPKTESSDSEQEIEGTEVAEVEESPEVPEPEPDDIKIVAVHTETAKTDQVKIIEDDEDEIKIIVDDDFEN